MGPPGSQHQQPAVRVRSDEFPVSSELALQVSIVEGEAPVAEDGLGQIVVESLKVGCPILCACLWRKGWETDNLPSELIPQT